MAFKDWLNRPVRLRMAIGTKGGKVFPRGMIAWVTNGWRGRLDLTEAEEQDGKWIQKSSRQSCTMLVRGVHPREVEVVDGEIPIEAKQSVEAIHYSIDFNKTEGEFLANILKDNSDLHAERLLKRVLTAIK